jgi:hypothetical protein
MFSLFCGDEAFGYRDADEGVWGRVPKMVVSCVCLFVCLW